MKYVAGLLTERAPETAKTILADMAHAMSFRAICDNEKYMCSDGFYAVSDDSFRSLPDSLNVVMEGEIYNYKDYCQQITGNKADDITNCIKKCYLVKGRDFARTLNGHFAIALWDSNTKTLYLARDHAGSHSLYYAYTKEGLVFASTIKAIAASGLVVPEIDPSSASYYFSSKALSPPRTMYKNIFALRPGHTLIYNKDSAQEYDYWKLCEVVEDYVTSADDLCSELRELVFDSISIRADFGGNFGTLLSGGIDTGAVACVLAQKHKTKVVGSFSITFDETFFSDADLQNELIEKLGFSHRRANLSADEYQKLLVKAVSYLDSPVNDCAFVGMYKAFELARRSGCESIFEGEGPDEIFPAGNTHGERQLLPLLRLPGVLRKGLFGWAGNSIPIGVSRFTKARRLMCRLLMEENERRLTWRTYFHNKNLCRLLHNDCIDGDPYEIGKEYLKKTKLKDSLNIYQYGLIKTFLSDDLLYKDERMASAHGLSNRSPFVDYRLVELALRIPSGYQIKPSDSNTDGIKLLYKQSLRGIVPDSILDRKKLRGFSHPTADWYRTHLKEFVCDTLLGQTTRQRGYFNMSFVEELVKAHMEGNADYDYPLNSMLIFELWFRNSLL